MKAKKIKVSITLDEDVADSIRQLAEVDDRSLSQYINIILRTHIASRAQASSDSSR